MFYYDGKEWKKNRYKVTYQAVVYTDELNRYENATVEDIILTPEQELRYTEVKFSQMTGDEFLQYVLNGIGAKPDTRTDIEKLIDLIPPESMTEDVVAMANRLTSEVV